MFGRFSERARRAQFWALMAAIKGQSSLIRPIHILTGIKLETPEVLEGIDFAAAEIEFPLLTHDDIAKQEEDGSIDMGFSYKGQEALSLAYRASKQFASKLVGPAHLLWGIFHADSEMRKRLEKANVTESTLASVCQNFPEFGEWEVMQQENLPKLSSCSGIGYDLHRLETGRKLMLGGIEVPFDRGPAGHSDGDVLCHAICDALLGAAGLGDIGTHFPDTDRRWQGVSSLVFLETVRGLLDERNFRIRHIDAVVITEKPKLAPHFPAMREALAKALDIKPQQINLKAKTNEGVDAIGRGEAIAAHAIATLEP